jgi:hypothetical protein
VKEETAIKEKAKGGADDGKKKKKKDAVEVNGI